MLETVHDEKERVTMQIHFAIIASVLLLPAMPVTAQQADKDPLADNPKLEQKVRVQAEGLSVGSLLARLSQAAGVTLKADSETVDDKVIVFGPERPLQTFLRDLAALLGDAWVPRKDADGERLVLVKSPRVRDREAELANAATRQMMAQLETQARALAETPAETLEQRARRAESAPLRRFLSDPKIRLALQFYAQLSLPQKEALFDRGHLRLFFSTLLPAQQQALLTVAAQQPPAAPRFDNRIVQVARRPGPPDLEFTLESHSDENISAFMNPPAITMFAALKAQLPLPSLHGNPYTGIGIAANASLPEVSLSDISGGAWPDRLRQLAEKTGVPVLADYYRLTGLPLAPKETIKGEGAMAALDTLGAQEGCLWWMRGRTLLFRKRDWFLRRQYEVPDRWLAEVSRRLQAEKGVPTYADVLRLTELTPRQQLGLLSLQETRIVFSPFDLRYDPRTAGLAELLAILKERPTPDGDGRLQIVNSGSMDGLAPEDRAKAEQEVSAKHDLTFDRMTGYQRQMIPVFLAAQSRDVSGEPWEKFRIWLRAQDSGETRRNYRHVPVTLSWQMGSSQNDYTLSLPLTLPDDRRAKTLVEVVP
jgi:hypothetical protein